MSGPRTAAWEKKWKDLEARIDVRHDVSKEFAFVRVLVMNAEADLQDAVLKLPEGPPAMPTVLGHTDVRVQNQASRGQSFVVGCLCFAMETSPLTRRVRKCRIMRNSLLCVFLRQNCTDCDQIINSTSVLRQHCNILQHHVQNCSTTMIVLRQSLTRFVATDLPLASQLLSTFSASMQSMSKDDILGFEAVKGHLFVDKRIPPDVRLG